MKGETPATDEMGTTASTNKDDDKKKGKDSSSMDWKQSNTVDTQKLKSYGGSFKISNDIMSKDQEITRASSKKGKLGRKNTMRMEDLNKEREDTASAAANGFYIILPEFTREQCYQELLPRVLKYDENLSRNIGLWREHANFLDKFSEQLELFHQPELHDLFAETVFNHIQQGNHLIRRSAIKVLVKMLCF